MPRGKKKISEKTSEGHLAVLHACVFEQCTYDIYTVAAAAHKRVVDVQTHPLSQLTQPSCAAGKLKRRLNEGRGEGKKSEASASLLCTPESFSI